MSGPPNHADDQEPGADVTITGVGLVTPLGVSPWATFRALLDSRTTADRLDDLPAGLDATGIARATGAVSLAAHAPADPALDLAERAGRQALADAGIEPESNQASTTDLWIASSKGAILTVLDPSQRRLPGLDAIVMGPHGHLAEHVRRRLGLGLTAAPVAACATSLIAMLGAADAVREGRSDRAIVIAVEAALHPLFVRSYERLGALAPIRPVAAHVARPLDHRRAGFTLCEVAAAVVIERAPLDRSVRAIWARVDPGASMTEPHHMVRAAAVFEAVERAARSLLPGARRISLIQPHAPGTADNDERELTALAGALGKRAKGAAVYASKGAIGHGLGASGLVNVVLSCLMMRTGKAPPMPWLTRPVESAFALSAAGAALERGSHLLTAAGFGGHVAAARLDPP